MTNQHSELSIVATNIGKRYLLRSRLRDKPGKRSRIGLPGRHAPDDYVWAIRHVDLTLERGEILGVIGRNGSGKTTLLRILAGVTTPTAGRAEIRGRVGALLGVGTGFHPQLTGRDNVMLSGAIMGLQPAEIESHFDEIVEFAEIGEYLDEPVKRYSSGMSARLAFSVALFLHADVMLVDEVLSVGDSAFGLKAADKMREMLRDGRSVIYVSHGMNSIRELCSRVLVMDHGRVAFTGSAEEATAFYEQAYVRRGHRRRVGTAT